MPCPVCNMSMYWPHTFRMNPVQAPDNMKVVYWSQAIWDQQSPTQQQDIISRVPSLLRLLQ